MHNLIVVATVLLLTYKFALSNWTFSLRLSSIQCCESPSCELVGTCNDLFVALCLLRESNRTTLDRQSCPLLIAGHDIIDRQLTPADGVDSFLDRVGMPNIPSPYQGGFQIYTAILTSPDIPPYRNDTILIDELFTEVVSRADGEEQSWIYVGERRKANISFSISIECSVGYGGEDCTTVYVCRENIVCDQTLSYCNSEGECICRDEDATCSSGSSDGETDLAPIIAAAVVSVILGLVVIIVIVVVVLILCHKKKEKQKSELTMLTGTHDTVTSLTISSTSSPSHTIPMYSKVNKDKKKKGNTRVEDVVYATTIHQQNPSEHFEMSTGGTVKRESQGLVYAELDVHRKIPPPKPQRTDIIESPTPNGEPEAVPYVTVNAYARPRIPPMAANFTGEVVYYSTAN